MGDLPLSPSLWSQRYACHTMYHAMNIKRYPGPRRCDDENTRRIIHPWGYAVTFVPIKVTPPLRGAKIGLGTIATSAVASVDSDARQQTRSFSA